MGSRGGDAGRHDPAPGQGTAKGRPGPLACLTQGCREGQKSPFPTPSPGLGVILNQPQYPAPPQPASPQITTRGREKGAIYRCRPCGCPNRAGWGGPGNSWGPGEEAGFPGGDTGPLTWSPQAYLSKRNDPTPTTTGSAKATGQGNRGFWGTTERENHISCTTWQQAEEVVDPKKTLGRP